MYIKSTQFQKVCLGSKVGSNLDQNEPFRLGFRSFASELMDRNSIKVFAFDDNKSSKNWKTEWVKLDSQYFQEMFIKVI